jgi:hypothetical protein
MKICELVEVTTKEVLSITFHVLVYNDALWARRSHTLEVFNQSRSCALRLLLMVRLTSLSLPATMARRSRKSSNRAMVAELLAPAWLRHDLHENVK